MELSIFLAKFMGIYLLIIGLIWFFRRAEMKRIMKRVFENPGIIVVSGVVSLMFGLAIAIAHPIWEPNWRVVITIIAYLSLIKGVIRIGFPETTKNMASSVMKGSGYWVVLIIIFIVGIYLTYYGFHEEMFYPVQGAY